MEWTLEMLISPVSQLALYVFRIFGFRYIFLSIKTRKFQLVSCVSHI